MAKKHPDAPERASRSVGVRGVAVPEVPLSSEVHRELPTEWQSSEQGPNSEERCAEECNETLTPTVGSLPLVLDKRIISKS